MGINNVKASANGWRKLVSSADLSNLTLNAGL
jgi:hypothetical protein